MKENMQKKSRQRILIADDSALNREILSAVLGDEYVYLYAENGLQALRLLAETADVALVLLDIHMPEMDGFGVLSVMKQRQWTEEIPVIIISTEEDADFIQRSYDLGATDYVNRPFNAAIVQRRVRNTLLLHAKQKKLTQLVEEQIYEREKNNSAMVSVLGHIIETRSFETGAHIQHVRVFTDILLRDLARTTERYSLSEEEIARIVNLSALHDIGKISIPSRILNKPGRLDAQEWEIMKTHTTIGEALVQNVQADGAFIRTLRQICRSHHERWDGKGYPDGLKGDAIPISAQVVAFADVIDALTSDRCYRSAVSAGEALNMIRSGECGAFNPLLLECMNAAEEEIRACLLEGGKDYDYRSGARHLAAAVLENENGAGTTVNGE